MKHLFAFLATLLFSVTFAQQQLIAIKGTTTDAIATTLEEAINIAQPNDKIYLPGGNYTLNDSIQKPVHIIGTGYNHLIPRATPITSFHSELKIGSQASGIIIEGILFDKFGIYVGCNNVSFRRILATYNNSPSPNAGRISIKYGISNINIYNSSIYIFGNYVSVTNFPEENKISNVSIFNSYIRQLCGIKSSTIKNSLVYEINANSNSIYQNSLVKLDYNGLSFGNNFYNSVFSTDFNLYVTNINTGYINSFPGVNDNYHLTSQCPIQNIGVYFGDYPWKDGGQPINPHITENNSFLDVQNEQFKLRVKVIPQTN